MVEWRILRGELFNCPCGLCFWKVGWSDEGISGTRATVGFQNDVGVKQVIGVSRVTFTCDSPRNFP